MEGVPPAPPVPDVKPGPTGEPPVKYVGQDEFAKVLARLDGLSAAVNRTQDALKQVKPVDQPPVAGETAITAQVAELRKWQATVQEQEKRQKDREALHALKTELVKGGVEPTQSDRFAKLLQLEQTDRIEVDENFRVHFKDGDKRVPAGEWVAAYLQTDDGKILLPPKPSPHVNTGNKVNFAGKVKVTKADLQMGRVSTDDIRSGRVIVED